MGYAYTHPTNPMLDCWVDEDFDPGPEGGKVYNMDPGSDEVKVFESKKLKWWQKDCS